jgi:hypothetical protein
MHTNHAVTTVNPSARFPASDWQRMPVNRFGRRTQAMRSAEPLTEDQMRRVAPSIFAEGKHASRSERYSYIPTIDVLRSLREEGLAPFMVAQGGSRIAGKAEFTKHMIRMRPVGGDADFANARPEAHEVVLINSHDGVSSYQIYSGIFRVVCLNGLVVGTVVNGLRVPHKGKVEDTVIEGAIRVLSDVGAVTQSVEGMKAITLSPCEEHAFASASLRLRYGDAVEGQPLAPINASRLMEPRRVEDVGHSLWLCLQRVQEHLLRGGQRGRSVQGRRLQTRPIGGIDRGVNLNRALWNLAEDMRRLKA